MKKLRTILGRVVRDIERKAGEIADTTSALLKAPLEQDMELSKRVMVQKRNSKNKVYSAQAPEGGVHQQGQASQTL